MGNAVPPNIRTRGDGDTVAFPQAGLQRNAKSMVSWFSGKSLKLLQPDKGGDGRVGERREEKGRGGERNEGERRGRGLRSVPPVPNLPLRHCFRGASMNVPSSHCYHLLTLQPYYCYRMFTKCRTTVVLRMAYPLCIQFALLPYTRVSRHLSQISGRRLGHISLPGVLRVASTRIIWRCRPALSHLTGSFDQRRILLRRLL